MNLWYPSEYDAISKSKFFAEQIEYLGYWITRHGIQHIYDKVEAFLNIKAPKTKKEEAATPFFLYSHFYRDMRFCRSEFLARIR
jgi:hypothetical protein